MAVGGGGTGNDRDSLLALRSHGSNLVGVPTPVLGGTAYNDAPTPLYIAGCRQEHAELFERLELADSPQAAADIFHGHLSAVFGLNPDYSGREGADGKRRFHASYLRLLKGWMFDSNSAEGAVLKGWVESRFGLLPTYHKEPLRRFSSEAWANYLAQKMSSRFNNNAIAGQLDLLYSFCQWSLAKGWFALPQPPRPPILPITADGAHLRLFRGVNGVGEHHVVERPDRRTAVIHLNNLVSFSCVRDIAGQFGDYLLEAQVPLTKIMFFRDLLPRYPFQGEGEFLVVGGDYCVNISVF